MDKEMIEDMKKEAVFQFQLQKEQVRYDAPVMLQAIQAYAELCKAEATERMAGCHICSSHTNVHDGTQHDWYERDMKDDANNRGDQSIADAISEQVTDPPDVPFEPIRALCIGCDMLYPIEDLTTRSTGRFCTTCYYLEAV